jgi:cleavage and polyadenylation specificity factor subunit 3
VEAVLDMALATISTLSESYTSGVSLSVADSFGNEKDEEADLRADEDTYQLRDGTPSKREAIESQPKEEEGSEDAEGSEDSDEILEVIG